MIKNIIFDVGMVLISYDNDTLMDSLGYDKKTQETVKKAMFENKLWDEGDRGAYSTEELLSKFIANAPNYEQHIRKAYDTVAENMHLFSYAVPWVKELKQRGYKLYILSNYSEKIYSQTKEKMRFLDYTDGEIFSYMYKVIKPEKKIYDILLEKYSLVPEECVFLDDREDNIAMAKSFGIHGIVFKNYEQAKRDLDELLKK